MTLDLAGICIFVVEDEPIIALDLKAILEDAGASVLGPAGSLPEAEALGRNERISLAILDMRIGNDTITPVADQLTERGIPLIFHTGQSPGEKPRERWPGCVVLRKPAGEKELLAKVRALLGKS